MKVAIFSDLHAHPWQEFAKLDNQGRNTRMMDCVNVLWELLAYCKAHGIAHILFGGDLGHKRGVQFTEVWNLMVAALAAIKDEGIETVGVDGNHDHADKAGRVHSLQALASMGLMTIPDRAYGASATVPIGDAMVSCFSYSDAPDALARALEDEAHESYGAPRIALFHHGFKGARVGTTIEHVVKEAIEPALLRGHDFRYVFSGHYHSRQPIGGVPNALYIGSPVEHTRASRDCVNKKGFLLYDFDTNKVTLVPLKRPRFVTLLESSLDAADVPGLVHGNFVDVVLDEGDSLDGVAQRLKRLDVEPAGLKAIAAPRAAVVQGPRLDIDATVNPAEAVDRYVDYQQEAITEQKLDALELKRMGREFLNRALQGA